MSFCTPCPPCDTEFPLLCEPLETTANGKRLVVEDSAACQKTIQTPVSQQVLKTDGAGNLTWTNGASGTVLRKDSTGLVEFATVNTVLQSAPVDLGSQPLTTTGNVGIGTSSPAHKLHIDDSGDNTYIGETQQKLETGTTSSGSIYFGDTFSNPTAGIEASYLSTNTTPSISIGVTRDGNKTRVTARYDNRIKFYTNNVQNMEITPNAISFNTLTTFANNAAALAGGLLVNDVYKTATGELRIVV